MVSTESVMRHILYTKRYLQDLLELDPEQLLIDFEPDTFGHSRELPELLCRGGIRYYYHCRGNDKEELYRWRASSGAELLVLRDPQWYYLRELDYAIACHVPEFCHRNHTTSALRIYGVGNHGGGPSRRDLERILDMQTWPLYPTMEFSTLHRFFQYVEQARDALPVVERELNYVFTGCYTAQSRLKQANRLGEDRLYDCEALSAMAKLAACDLKDMPETETAWRGLLFNQFHDILPGSCTREAKERALGRFQDLCAYASAVSRRAMDELGKKIATDLFPAVPSPDSLADSAAHGFGSAPSNSGRQVYSINVGSRSSGAVRVYTVFNPTAYLRSEIIELTLWDWEAPMASTAVWTADGDRIFFDIAEQSVPYWQHQYSVIRFPAQIPPFGYSNYYITNTKTAVETQGYFSGPRVHPAENTPIVLENDQLRAVFSRKTMMLEGLQHKASGAELVHSPAAYFMLIDEQTVLPYSAWTVGREGRSEILNEHCFIQIEHEDHGRYSQAVSFRLQFRNSTLHVRISLPEQACVLRYSVRVDWQERGSQDTATPQLRFCVPFSYDSAQSCYEIPGGHIFRSPLAQDVPALRFAAPIPNARQPAIFLTSDCKYGYRTFGNVLSVNVLRSSVSPDPDPEHGVTHAELGLGVLVGADWESLTQQAVCFSHRLYVYSNSLHSGSLPQRASFLRIKGRAAVAALKLSEDGAGVLLRVSQQDSVSSCIDLETREPMTAAETDLGERPVTLLAHGRRNVSFDMSPHSLRSVLLFQDDPP